MVELIGDNCEPSDLKVPYHAGQASTMSGALFMSGAKLYFDTGAAIELITST